MASSAILAIRIISDATKAAKGFQQAETSAQKMERRMGTASKIATGGLLAMGAAAISAAKNAAEDAASQRKLAIALRNTAGATAKQVAGVESYISKVGQATGVTDDQMRPALQRLVQSTGDIGQAQKLMSLALDASAGSGKSLETVTTALAKANSGNMGALSRLGIRIKDAEGKSLSFTQVTKQMGDTFKGQAAAAANTLEGRMARLKLSYDEAREELGTALLPILTKFATSLAGASDFAQKHSKATKVLIVTTAGLAAAVIGVNAAYKAYKSAAAAAAVVQKVLNVAMRANPIGLIITAVALLIAGLVLAYKKSEKFRLAVNVLKDGSVAAFKVIWGWVKKVVEKVSDLVGWIKKIKWPKVPKAISGLFGGEGGPPRGPGGGAGGGGFAYSSRGGRGGPGGGGFLLPVAGSGGPAIVNITIEGAIDPQGTARQIRQILGRYDVRLGGQV